MAAKPMRSGELLARMWNTFLERHSRQYAHAKPPSKREMAKLLNVDALALARWTNDQAHTSKHPGWRIPLKRIPEACTALLATGDELDELMLCRLQEIQAEDEKADIQVLLHWLGPLLQDLAARPAVDADERLILEEHRRARDSVPGSEHVSLPSSAAEALNKAFVDVWRSTVNEHVAELQADTQAEDADISANLERAKQRVKEVLARKAPSAAQSGFRKQTKDAVQTLRKAIRSAG